MLVQLVFFVLAACLASFTNLCAYRLGCGQRPWYPRRSYCESCHHLLTWWQLIPIGGYLIQGGHCCYCHHSLNYWWPLSEAGCGLGMSLLATGQLHHDLLILAWLMGLLFITTTDGLYQCLYPISLLGLSPLFFLIPNWHWPEKSELILSLIFLIIISIPTYYYHAMGSGDVMFLTITFIVFGWYWGIVILLIACLFTLLWFKVASTRRLPFLPDLCFATILIFIFFNR